MMKKWFKILLVIAFLIGFKPCVRGLEWNDESTSGISFVDGYAIINGTFDTYLTVDDVLSKFDFDYEENGVENIYLLDSNGNLLNGVVVSGSKLVIDLAFSDDLVYDVCVVGDIDRNGLVDKQDVEALMGEIVHGESVNRFYDVNGDLVLNINDVTYLKHAIEVLGFDNRYLPLDRLEGTLESNATYYVGDYVPVCYTIRGFINDKLEGLEGILDYDKALLRLDSVVINGITYSEEDFSHKFVYLFDDSFFNNEVTVTFLFQALTKGEGTVSLGNIITSSQGERLNLDRSFVSSHVTIEEYGIGGDDDLDATVPSEEESIKSYPVQEAKDGASVVQLSKPVTMDNNRVSAVREVDVSRVEGKNVTLSNDNYIEFLSIKGHRINFDREKTSYDITVDSDVSSIDLEVILSDEEASYEILGNEKFKAGKNDVQIVVTALDGSKRTYTIHVNKKSDVSKEEKEESNSSRVVLIVLIILVIIGLIYVIFKDDEEEESRRKNDSK